MEPRRYRFGRKPEREKTYEELLLDLKQAIERTARIGKYKKRKKKTDGDT